MGIGPWLPPNTALRFQVLAFRALPFSCSLCAAWHQLISVTSIKPAWLHVVCSLGSHTALARALLYNQDIASPVLLGSRLAPDALCRLRLRWMVPGGGQAAVGLTQLARAPFQGEAIASPLLPGFGLAPLALCGLRAWWFLLWFQPGKVGYVWSAALGLTQLARAPFHGADTASPVLSGSRLAPTALCGLRLRGVVLGGGQRSKYSRLCTVTIYRTLPLSCSRCVAWHPCSL